MKKGKKMAAARVDIVDKERAAWKEAMRRIGFLTNVSGQLFDAGMKRAVDAMVKFRIASERRMSHELYQEKEKSDI